MPIEKLLDWINKKLFQNKNPFLQHLFLHSTKQEASGLEFDPCSSGAHNYRPFKFLPVEEVANLYEESL